MFHPIIGDTYNIQSNRFFHSFLKFKKKTQPQVVGFYKGRSILAFWTFYILLLEITMKMVFFWSWLLLFLYITIIISLFFFKKLEY